MSLVSASSFIGGVKEYLYRGFQQLPLVLVMTSFTFSVTTGSIAHTVLFVGLTFIVPIYTWLLQTLVGFATTNRWNRSKVDTCNIITDYKSLKTFQYYVNNIHSGENIPSFWITSVFFFFGYVLTNAHDSLTATGDLNNKLNYEKRITVGMYITFCSFFVGLIIIGLRFSLMSDCEGTGRLAYIISIFFGLTSAGIGYGLYNLSKKCGARSSDLLGILSQIIPASASSPSPTVCMAQN